MPENNKVRIIARMNFRCKFCALRNVVSMNVIVKMETTPISMSPRELTAIPIMAIATVQKVSFNTKFLGFVPL